MFPARGSAFRQYADQGVFVVAFFYFDNSDWEHFLLLHQVLEILCNFHYSNVTLLCSTETEGMNDSLVFVRSHFFGQTELPML